MRIARQWMWAVLFFCLTAWSRVAHAQTILEAQEKAALILKIATDVEWPTDKLPPNAPFVIGVIGSEAIFDRLTEGATRRIQNRDVVVKRFTAIQEIMACHVLFVCSSEQPRMREIAGKTRGRPILTISDSQEFLERGGIVLLFRNGNGMRFTFDSRNFRRSELKLGPWLLDAISSPTASR